MRNSVLPNGFRNVPEHHAAIIGALLIGSGVISVIIGAIDLSVIMPYSFYDQKFSNIAGFTVVAAPIWGGLIYFITGILACVSRKTKDVHTVNAFFTFSIFTIVSSLVAMVTLVSSRSVSADHSIYVFGMVGIIISVLSFLLGICGAVVASHGLDCECCKCCCECCCPAQSNDTQYLYYNNPNQVPQQTAMVMPTVAP